VNFANELLDGEDLSFLELDENNAEHVPTSKKLKRMPLPKWVMRSHQNSYSIP
jgi:hypothetical protein